MLRLISYLFWIAVMAVLVVVGLANRGFVTLRAMPEALATLVGLSPDVELPLFLVIFLSVAVGLLIGFAWEWLREGPLRAEMREKSRTVEQLKREVGRIRAADTAKGDDILALLDSPAKKP